MPPIKTISFIGHRPGKLGGYRPNPISIWVKQALNAAIEKTIENRVYRFICGGSLGADQWAAESVVQIRDQATGKSYQGRSGIELIIAQAFPSQSQNWPQENRWQYDKLLQKADQILAVDDDPYEAWKDHRRNIWLAENSDAMIAVWDGEPGRVSVPIGHAKGLKKPVLVIDPIEQTERWLLKESDN